MTASEALVHVRASRERDRRRESLQEEALRLQSSLFEFLRAAWPIVVPSRYVDTWHVRTLAEHVQAAYDREIPRLLITIQPGSLKSSIISVMAPAWQWTRDPRERFVTASHSDDLATRDTRRSRALMQTSWFQERWPVEFSDDENLKTRYSNTLGGHRIRTHVGGGTGDRGSILQLDDPHNAAEAHSATQMQGAADWWSDTWASRLDDSVEARGVKVVVGQRIHEDDLIGHLLANDRDAGRWVHLCLPAEYESEHPFAYPAARLLPSGKIVQGDVRDREGELLAPSYMDQERLSDKTADMTAHIYAGQYQQRPTAREGDLLKRSFWRFYPPRRNEETDDEFVARLPRFRRIVSSWDTPLKERETNDLIAGQLYGEHGGDRYLLDSVQGHMNFSTAKRAVTAQYDFARKLWPDAQLRVLIEKGGYGLDLARELAREITGVTAIPEKGDRLPDKYARAESASASLESGNVFLPGYRSPTLDGPDEARCPASTVGLIATCAAFPNGRYKDPVDAWSQAMNWLDKHRSGGSSISSPRRAQLGDPNAIPR